MHLVVPFAASVSEAGAQALHSLRLPRLEALLARLQAAAPGSADADSLNPPHEQVLAACRGWQCDDGRLPFAAALARDDGVEVHDAAWGLLTPAHWHVGTDQVTLADPEDLQLDEVSSRAFLEAVHDLFASEGFVLVWGAPLRWYLAHESLAEMATASLDRVIGRNVDPWLPPSRAAQLWRRLQNEVQMRLYGHPLNDEREARGLPPVNSLWLSGCGVRQRVASDAEVTVDDRLRRPALAEDWGAWIAAWQALDAGAIAALRGQAATLTLCGERCAAQWSLQPPTAWQSLSTRFRRNDPRVLLETL